MDIAPTPAPMTREAFLDWAERQELPYEFDGLQPVPMNGGNNGHFVIAGNIFGELRDRLKGGPCQPIPAGAGVATIGAAVRFPDVSVTCSPVLMKERLVPSPIVVFEVSSPSSIRNDWKVKLKEYAAVASILRCIIVEQDSAEASVMSRPDGSVPWSMSTLTTGDTVMMPEIGIEVPLDLFYNGLTFEA